MADNFQSSKVTATELSSSTKFNNFVQAVEDAINSLDNSNIGAAAAILVTKLAAGSSGQWLRTSSGIPTWTVLPGPPILSPGPSGATVAGVANTVYLTELLGVFGDAFTMSKFLYVVSTQSGNMDLGIYYSDDLSTFTRLFSTASFAVPAVGKTTTSFAAQTIAPVAGRHWFFAVAVDNATAQFRAVDSNLTPAYSKATSFPLPASLSAMTALTANVISGSLLA